MQKKRINFKNKIYYLIIVISVFMCGNIAVLYPGLYYDAVMPDYIAAIFSNPSEMNSAVGSFPSYLFYPKLGSLYHGTITAMVQTIVGVLLRTTNIVIYRNVNLLYLGIIFCIMYKIFYFLGIPKKIVLPILMLGIFNASTIFVTRTQYYVMLPGVVFLFLSVLFLLYELYNVKCWKIFSSYNNSIIWCFFSGISLGMAFYCYFCYLFFLPAFLLSIYKDVKSVSKKILMWILGFIGGSFFYFLGYFEAIVINIVPIKQIQVILTIVFCIVFISFIFMAMKFILNEKRTCFNIKRALKIITFIIFIVVVLGIVLIILKRDIILEKFSSFSALNLSGEKVALWERAQLFVRYFCYCTTMNFPCYAMFQEQIILCPNLYIILFGCSLIFILIYQDKLKENSLVKWCVWAIVSFFICSFGLISRMQSQHFVAFYFIFYIVFIIVTNELFNMKHVRGALKVIWGICIIINICNVYNVATELERTRGKGSYTDGVNQEAKLALEEFENGMKDVYVSLDWGFKAGFIYLTNDKILCYESIYDDDNISNWDINDFLENGYRVILVSSEYGKVLENESYFKVEGEKRIYYDESTPRWYLSVVD